MTDLPRLKVLLVAPHLDAEDVGESMTAFHLVKEMSQRADLTVLALECTHGPPLAEQLPDAEVITWDEPAWMRRNMRLRALLKPNVSFLARRVKRWLATRLGRGAPL